MAQSEKAKEILRRLEEGTGEIYSRYESLIKSSDAAYDAKIRAVDADYTAAANRASANAKIDLKNSLEKMADAGYIGAGETVQATIAANSDKARALSDLALQKAKDKNAYETEKENARATLSLQGEKEAMDYEASMAKALQEQENLEREWEAEEKQREFENALKAETLALQKAEFARKGEETKKEEGIEPEKSPYEYVDDIVEKNTSYNKKKGYKVIDRKAILLAISSIVKNKELSYRYRYEMYLYGKSLGYIKD